MPGSALAVVDPGATAVDLLHEVMAATPIDTRVELCIQCGTCGGSCPSAADMDHTPRMLFAMIRAGLRDGGPAEQHALDVRRPATTAPCAARRRSTSPT